MGEFYVSKTAGRNDKEHSKLQKKEEGNNWFRNGWMNGQ
jgi:hypothetical protein